MAPFPAEIWRPKTSKFRRDFGQLRDLIANISGTQQDVVSRKNDIANYRNSRTGKLNSVYFGPQTAKNRIGVYTDSTGGYQARHCHASSINNIGGGGMGLGGSAPGFV